MTVCTPQPPPPSPTLSTLPYDILRIVTAHIPTATSVANFSATSKNLSVFVALEGWRVFVQTRFPSFHAEVIRQSQSQPQQRAVKTEDWCTWAQEQTLVDRNWQRRGFIAKVLEPEVFIHVPSGPRLGGGGGRGRGAPPRTTKWAWSPSASRGRQTMKYLPVLDVYESVWSSGEEVLGIGAGPDLVIRKRGGDGDEAGRKGRWWGFENLEERAGRDDVTAIQLLRPSETGSYAAKGEVAIVGRVNGKLEMVALRTDSDAGCIGKSEVLKGYETGGLTVKSASVLHRGGGSSHEGMMSAVLGNSNITMYAVDTPGPQIPVLPVSRATVQPFAEIVLPDGEIAWQTTFLSPSLLALGKTSSEPLSVYTVSPQEGIRNTPLRTFSAKECTGIKTVGVYATASLPTSIGSSENAGEVFLGGWYDGVSRLHDLRSPAQFVASYADPIDAQTPIYSLCPLGRQRFIVGGGRHCILKIFDLRMPGGRVYDYLQSSPSPAPVTSTPPTDSPGWATYLSPPARYRPHSNSADWESPIYALALSASGKSVYAGAQGRIWEVDFAGTSLGGAAERPLSPGPQVQPSVRVRNAAVNAVKDVGTRLTMYEFGWTGTMYHQGPESEMGKGGINGGRMDARWRATLASAE